ncbi:MAG: M23 family peptidase, partial [Alistipes sp.]|nr:M23 family peptidase [Alistipes sp.]
MATKRNITPKPRRSRKQQILRLVISLLGGLGAVILYYLAFSIFFDTPMEYALKHRTDRLKQEYVSLEGRYDSLMRVLEILSERDRAIFHSLFESDPYDFDSEYERQRNATYEAMFSQSNRRL